VSGLEGDIRDRGEAKSNRRPNDVLRVAVSGIEPAG